MSEKGDLFASGKVARGANTSGCWQGQFSSVRVLQAFFFQSRGLRDWLFMHFSLCVG